MLSQNIEKLLDLILEENPREFVQFLKLKSEESENFRRMLIKASEKPPRRIKITRKQ